MTQKRLDLNFDGMPTTTVLQARLQLAQPTRRPKMLRREIETPWGHGIVLGKYGQAHVDLMESIFKHVEKYRKTEDGAIELIVDPHKVRMSAGGNKQISGSQMDVLKLEIMQVVIDLKGNGIHDPIAGHIIDEIRTSAIKAPSRPGAINGENRYMWYVRLGPAYLRFLQDDLHLHYDPEPIAALTTGIAQAVARHVATHKTEPHGGWKVDGLIEAVGGGKTTKQLQNQRADLKTDQDGLKNLGLTVEDGRVKRIVG